MKNFNKQKQLSLLKWDLFFNQKNNNKGIVNEITVSINKLEQKILL